MLARTMIGGFRAVKRSADFSRLEFNELSYPK
jgi:hypothetical protein